MFHNSIRHDQRRSGLCHLVGYVTQHAQSQNVPVIMAALGCRDAMGHKLSPQDDASDSLMPPARPQPHHLAAARGGADADGRALLQQFCDFTARAAVPAGVAVLKEGTRSVSSAARGEVQAARQQRLTRPGPLWARS